MNKILSINCYDGKQTFPNLVLALNFFRWSLRFIHWYWIKIFETIWI